MQHANGKSRTRYALLVVVAGGALACADRAVGPSAPATDAAAALKTHYSAWSPAVSIEAFGAGADASFNTAALEGCPFIAPDGKTLFIASNRPGGYGGIDIYVSTRASEDEPWSAPVNLGPTVNSASNEFCPTLARDRHTFYFVSNRPGGCGGDDIYVTRFRGDGTIDEPENLGCQVNSAGNEAGPFPIPEPGRGPVLYFSSTRAGGYAPEAPGAITGDADIYMSEWHGGAFGPAHLVSGVNSASDELQPNLRRDALEIFLASNRPGTLGLFDIYSATREKAQDDWSTPVNLGPQVNSAGSETRPSLSWDGTTLYFGSTRAGGEGSSDVYATSRHALHGNGH